MFSKLVILLIGALYPAYSTFKVLKKKKSKSYVKWMMYWTGFAFFICGETFADALLSWFPFYYPLKIIFVIWLLSPVTKGSSILYRKLIHPALKKQERQIDRYLGNIQKAANPFRHTSTASLEWRDDESEIQENRKVNRAKDKRKNRCESVFDERGTTATLWASNTYSEGSDTDDTDLTEFSDTGAVEISSRTKTKGKHYCYEKEIYMYYNSNS